MTNHIHLIAIPGTTESMSLALGEAHSRYTLELNRQQHWGGHLWPLGETHLMAVLHYVEQNPVRARMVDKAWDWPWSSARVHTNLGARDELVGWDWMNWMKEARLGEWNDAEWKQGLAGVQPAEELERIRRATRLGEPLGDDAFVSRFGENGGAPITGMGAGEAEGGQSGSSCRAEVAFRGLDKCRLSPLGECREQVLLPARDIQLPTNLSIRRFAY